VEAHDNVDIADTDLLIRRIDAVEHIVPDGRGGKRVSSEAFKPSSRPPYGLSIDVKRLIESAGIEPVIFVTTPKFRGSVEFAASIPRSVDLMVGLDPLPENKFHGEIWGKVRPDRFTGSQERALQNGASWLVAIPGVQPRQYNP